MKFQTPEQQMEAIVQLTHIGNAGFIPHQDVIEPFIESRKGVMPIDIDLIARDYEERKTKKWEEIGKKLTFWIEKMTDDPVERHRLALAAHREARGPFRKYIPWYNGK